VRFGRVEKYCVAFRIWEKIYFKIYVIFLKI